MNTDYWCFGSRYPRSIPSTRYPPTWKIFPLSLQQESLQFWLRKKQGGQWFLDFSSTIDLILCSPSGFCHQALFPALGKPILSLIDRIFRDRLGVVIVSSWRKRRTRYTQTPQYYRVERSIRLLRSVQCFAGWEAGSESYVDVDGDGEIGSGW